MFSKSNRAISGPQLMIFFLFADYKSLSDHPSLLRPFGFSAVSTYDSYLPSIFGTNDVI